jgi:hypothetical protein
MFLYDENALRLLTAAEAFVSKNDKLHLAAETIAQTALKVANGDMDRAEALLHRLGEFSWAAIFKLRERSYEPPLSYLPFDAIQHHSRMQPSNDVSPGLLPQRDVTQPGAE